MTALTRYVTKHPGPARLAAGLLLLAAVVTGSVILSSAPAHAQGVSGRTFDSQQPIEI